MTSWAQTFTERLAVALTWDKTNRFNRADARAWRRRLWWARFGSYVSESVGGAAGTATGLLVVLII